MPAEGRITTRVLTKGQRAVVEIGVHGMTLPPEDLASFFEIGGQRTLFKGGADFGLSPVLSSRIVQFFGGDVFVRNAERDGFAIEVVLPLQGEP
jgi:signal transduction histidine kinase